MVALKDIQGDIWPGLQKETETFWFFTIDDGVKFLTRLATLTDLITTAQGVLDAQEQINQHNAEQKTKGIPELDWTKKKISGINVAFTSKGLRKMKITGITKDTAFEKGMREDAKGSNGLGDPPWDPLFPKEIHGVVLITGESRPTAEESLDKVKKIFSVRASDAVVHEVLRIDGDVRPKPERGFEHFGFKDGISEPAIKGLDDTIDKKLDKKFDVKDLPPTGIMGLESILLGSDTPWSKDGSFLCFRQLSQQVPEFNAFLEIKAPLGMKPERLGARLMGRWKSGTPVVQSPDEDKVGTDDPSNSFSNNLTSMQNCPFAAHIIKTNPRSGFTVPIIRRGIPFGPEVSSIEKTTKKTNALRGLLFVSYQSSIDGGFGFMQKSWANNADFPVRGAGLDPIIGQGTRTISGTDPKSLNAAPLKLDTWVEPKGGEYFFSPSILMLKTGFAPTPKARL